MNAVVDLPCEDAILAVKNTDPTAQRLDANLLGVAAAKVALTHVESRLTAQPVLEHLVKQEWLVILWNKNWVESRTRCSLNKKWGDVDSRLNSHSLRKSSVDIKRKKVLTESFPVCIHIRQYIR